MSATSALPMFLQFFNPNNSGAPAVGFQLFTYQAGTTTKQATWTDSSQGTQNANPLALDANGRAIVWGDPTLSYKFVLAPLNSPDPPTSPVWTQDDIEFPLDLSVLTQAVIGGILYPQTAAEAAAGVTPANYAYAPGDVRRYGIVPNSTGAGAANSTALQALLNASVTGPTGRLVFPNTTGSDIYYFGGIAHQIRDGIRIDLMGSTLNFSKSYSSGTDDFHGFLECIRDVTVENGSIVVDYTGTGSNNPGMVFRIGSRNGYPFGTFTNGIFDQDDLVANGIAPMGNITLRNLRITSNNAVTHMIVMTGGLQNVLCENLILDGSSLTLCGIYYEYGFASTNGAPTDDTQWSSSHGNNLTFRNIRVENTATGADNSGIALFGAYNSSIAGLYVKNADHVFEFNPGEALFYRPWSGVDDAGAKRGITLKNIVGEESIASVGLVLTGAQSASASYLSAVISALGHPADYAAQTDLMSFSVEGFALAAAVGIEVSGDCSLRDGLISGGTGSGGIIVTDECMHFEIENVRVLNSGGIGIRGDFGSAIWSPARLKAGSIIDCKICGNTNGITLDNCSSVRIEGCQLGYSTTYDVAAETTQNLGVSLGASAAGVRCRGNYTTVKSGGHAYSTANATTNAKNRIEDESVTQTVTGLGYWLTDFLGAAQSIASNGTIAINGLAVVQITASGNVTGMILQAGYADGQRVSVCNRNSVTVTFDVSGTSNVADGTSDVIAALHAASYIWNTSTDLWYRV